MYSVKLFYPRAIGIVLVTGCRAKFVTLEKLQSMTTATSSHKLLGVKVKRTEYVQWRDMIAALCGWVKRLMGGSSSTLMEARLNVVEREEKGRTEGFL